MKKVIVTVGFLLCILSLQPLHTQQPPQQVEQPQSKSEDSVYVCMGTNSECYHKTDTCEGLNYCTREVKKVTKKEAKEEMDRRECKICYEKF